MTWVLEWSFPHENNYNINFFASEELANKQACAEILTHIRSYLDLSKPDVLYDVHKINDYIKNGNYKEAVSFWDGCDSNRSRDEFVLWFVYKAQPLSYSATPNPLSNSELGIVTPVVNNPIVVSAPFVATSPGAICRCCHNHNDYAYADKPDGTYECRSCKMMKDVFA